MCPLPVFWEGGLVLHVGLCFAVRCIISSFAIISLGKRELVTLLCCVLIVTALLPFFNFSS